MSDELRSEYEFDPNRAKPNRFTAGPTVPMKPLVEVTRQAIEVLYRELGPVDAMRFIGQFTNGRGDYTADRDKLFGQAKLEDLIAGIKAMNKS